MKDLRPLRVGKVVGSLNTVGHRPMGSMQSDCEQSSWPRRKCCRKKPEYFFEQRNDMMGGLDSGSVLLKESGN